MSEESIMFTPAEKPDPGITCRQVKFSQTGIDLLKILKTKFPGETISGLVLRGLKALLKFADAAPVIRYMRLPGKEIIYLRAILAAASEILQRFRSDLLVARGTPAMLCPLVIRTEEAIEKVTRVTEEVAQLAGVAQPTPEEIDQLELATFNLQAQVEMEETDDKVRESLKCAIRFLGIKLPHTP